MHFLANLIFIGSNKDKAVAPGGWVLYASMPSQPARCGIVCSITAIFFFGTSEFNSGPLFTHKVDPLLGLAPQGSRGEKIETTE